MTGTTLIAYLIFAAVIFNFDPRVAGPTIIVFFYASLFLSLLGTFSVVGFILRHWFGKDGIIFRQVITSFRQSILLSLIAISSLFMQQTGVLRMPLIVLLIAAMAILELFFITKRANKSVL